jgi:hypothetical protein
MSKRVFKVISVGATLILLIFGASCSKDEGEGGSSTIKGIVWVKNYNSTFTQLISEYPAADEDIYIVYGNHDGYDDRTRADYNGVFRFDYLRKGNYTLYVYSKDSTMQSPSGKVAVIVGVEISRNKQVVEVPRIEIFK